MIYILLCHGCTMSGTTMAKNLTPSNKQIFANSILLNDQVSALERTAIAVRSLPIPNTLSSQQFASLPPLHSPPSTPFIPTLENLIYSPLLLDDLLAKRNKFMTERVID